VFYTSCQKAISDSSGAEHRVTWAHIKNAMGPLLQKIIGTKFVDPKMPAEPMSKYFQDIVDETHAAFQSLND